jgi:hypothetical protein
MGPPKDEGGRRAPDSWPACAAVCGEFVDGALSVTAIVTRRTRCSVSSVPLCLCVSKASTRIPSTGTVTHQHRAPNHFQFRCQGWGNTEAQRASLGFICANASHSLRCGFLSGMAQGTASYREATRPPNHRRAACSHEPRDCRRPGTPQRSTPLGRRRCPQIGSAPPTIEWGGSRPPD